MMSVSKRGIVFALVGVATLAGVGAVWSAQAPVEVEILAVGLEAQDSFFGPAYSLILPARLPDGTVVRLRVRAERID